MTQLQKVCFISDNHNQFPKIPQCDILVHAGDLTSTGSTEEAEKMMSWFAEQKAPKKIFIPGNHDWYWQEAPEESRRLCEDLGVELLIDQEVLVNGLRFYGSPFTPEFCNWAFNLDEMDLQDKWNLIPRSGDIDVLVTHGPAKGYLDLNTPGEYNNYNGQHVGDWDLRQAIVEVKPRVHVFGHCHFQNGILHVNDYAHNYLAVNATVCNEKYQCINPPQILWL